MVITTYSTLASELATHTGGGKSKDGAGGKGKAKGKGKGKDAEAEVEEDAAGSESDDSLFGKSLATTKKKPAAPKRAPKAKAKPSALYEVNFWRIVLGASFSN